MNSDLELEGISQEVRAYLTLSQKVLALIPNVFSIPAGCIVHNDLPVPANPTYSLGHE